MASVEEDLLAGICNRALGLEARIDLVGRLSAINPELALRSVIRIAEDDREDRATLVAMGRRLAVIAELHRYPTEFESRDILEPAYDEFCDPSE